MVDLLEDFKLPLLDLIRSHMAKVIEALDGHCISAVFIVPKVDGTGCSLSKNSICIPNVILRALEVRQRV